MREVNELQLLKLEIHNYGYWENLELKFADSDGKPYSTVLLHGLQNSGKSTIGRALRWLLYSDMMENPELKFPNKWNKNFSERQYVRATYLTNKDEVLIATRTRTPPIIKTTKIELKF